MHTRQKFLLAAAIFFLAGCQRSPLAAPAATPDVWRVQMPASLAWVGAELNACTLQQPGVVLLVEPQPLSDPVSETAQIILRWGDPDPADQNIWYQIGEDNLVMITHPDNPATEISSEQLRQFFTGQMRSWSEVSDFSEAVTPVDLPEENEIRQALTIVLGEKPTLNASTLIAADAVTMRQAVAARPGAIGYLPARWLDDSVKELPVIPTRQPIRTSFPVLIRFVETASPAQQTWLDCLQ